jgi:hypothetical protein
LIDRDAKLPSLVHYTSLITEPSPWQDEAGDEVEEAEILCWRAWLANEYNAGQAREHLDSVEKALSELRESKNKREADVRGFKVDIETIRELIPKVVKPQDFIDRARLWNEIKNLKRLNCKKELKSLKSLLMDRTS